MNSTTGKIHPDKRHPAPEPSLLSVWSASPAKIMTHRDCTGIQGQTLLLLEAWTSGVYASHPVAWPMPAVSMLPSLLPQTEPIMPICRNTGCCQDGWWWSRQTRPTVSGAVKRRSTMVGGWQLSPAVDGNCPGASWQGSMKKCNMPAHQNYWSYRPHRKITVKWNYVARFLAYSCGIYSHTLLLKSSIWQSMVYVLPYFWILMATALQALLNGAF